MSFVDIASASVNALIGDALAPYALFSSPSRCIATLIPDVTVEEVHNDRLEVTQHPIQTGAVVTDHSFALPAQLTIRCGYSDSTGGFVGYSQEIYAEILALQASREPFNVSTGKRLYSNMLIRDMQVTTDPTSEYALMLVVNLQQLTFTDATSSGSGLVAANQAFPQDTAPSVNGGTVSLIPMTAAPQISGGLGKAS